MRTRLSRNPRTSSLRRITTSKPASPTAASVAMAYAFENSSYCTEQCFVRLRPGDTKTAVGQVNVASRRAVTLLIMQADHLIARAS